MVPKGVKLSDGLVALGVIVVMGALLGAILGFSQNRFGLSSPIRVAIIAAFCALAGRLAQVIVTRRVKARSAPTAANRIT